MLTLNLRDDIEEILKGEAEELELAEEAKRLKYEQEYPGAK